MAIGQTEILVIVLIVILLFGATAIPKLARSLGRAQGEFKRAKSEFDSERVKGEAEAATGPSEEQIRRTAKELGIEEEGKSLDEVKQRINEKLG
jgi:sec-independent protein translocase protein TatA